MRAQNLVCVAFLAVVSALAAPALAEFSLSGFFPNPDGIYYSVNTGFYPVPPGTPGAPPAGGLVTLEGLRLSSPTASIPRPPAPATAAWIAGASFNADTFMSFFGGPTLPDFSPGDTAAASITGLVDAPPLHTYATEMLALDLVGLPFGARIRESPTRPSLGGHTVVGAGPYQIDSFFDVFTELSLDGGATWIPSTDSVHIINPEPGSLALLIGAAPLVLRRRRLTH